MKSTIKTLFIVISFYASVSTQAVAQYTVTDLGTLDGGTWSIAYDINNNGQIIGTSESSLMQSGFLYSGSSMSSVGPADDASLAASINDNGVVVGNHYGTGDFFVSDNGKFSNVGNVLYFAYDINNSGKIVGTDTFFAFLYDGGVYAKFSLSPFGNFSIARSINDGGKIVGESPNSANITHAFLYENGGMTDLNIWGGSESAAYDINNNGQIVGWAKNTSGSQRAILYEDGIVTDLGDGIATKINASGQVVINSNNHSYLYCGGTTTDLNFLIPSSSGWNIRYASAINDLGQIVGSGVNSHGESHAFLLTPVPEPSTIALLIMATLGGIFWWRRRKSIQNWGCIGNGC